MTDSSEDLTEKEEAGELPLCTDFIFSSGDCENCPYYEFPGICSWVEEE